MMLGERKGIMRWSGVVRLLFGAGLALALCHSAAKAADRIRVAQSSIVTNCMIGVQLAGRNMPEHMPHPGHAADRRRYDRGQCQSEHGLSAQLHDPTDQLPDVLRTHFAVTVARRESN